MRMRGWGFLVFTLGATGGPACSSSPLNTDASGSGRSNGICNAADSSYPATRADPDAPPCAFQLPPPGIDLDLAHIAVIVDGTQIPDDPSHQNGWDYVGDNTQSIQIWGPTCDAIEAGTGHTICIEARSISARETKPDFGRARGRADVSSRPAARTGA